MIVGTEAVVGAWINAFIVMMCCIDRFKNKFLGAGDKILMFLAANRFCFLIAGMLQELYRTLSPAIYYKYIHRGVRAILWFFISSNLWLAACLCVFYCVKIANFNHSLFIYLKLKISSTVPVLLLGSELLSLVNTFPFFSMIYIPQGDIPNATATGNITVNQIQRHTDLFKIFLYCGLGFFVVLVIFIISALLLLISLWQHARQLRDGFSGYRSPRMATHVRAVKIITYFLVTYLVNFVALMVLLMDIFSEDSALNTLCTVIVYACPSMHSVMLILTNPKFKKAFLQTLQRGSCKW
ncbi:taste receptor type 2 member 40-like [Eublepharis macularius]|uniref:Taste receptor type 2 n=1 Tax=Eublepharis macularius TaxID=481883 RepID=A0AA97IW95_EUBMA|nr:taste receptor type 2 member 40-like [Eublepharis macularius]